MSPATTAARPATADDPLVALPTDLPPVERRAAIPAGFRAGGGLGRDQGLRAAGPRDHRDAAGRVRAGGPGERRRRLHAERVRRRAGSPLAGPPPRRRRRPAAARTASPRPSSRRAARANAATGAAGDADQAEVAGLLAEALGIATAADAAPLDRASSGRGCRSTGWRPGSTRSPRASPRPTTASPPPPRRSARPTRGPKAATVTFTLPDPDGLAVRPIRVTGIAKGVGMIHPRMATMLAVVLTDAAAEPAAPPLAAPPGRRRGRGTSSASTATRARTTRCSCSRRARPARPRSARARTRRATLGLAIEAVARELARQQAADGEGATTLVTCQVSGATDDADARAVARAVISSSLVKAAVHGRDPNWGRIAGAAGNARLADAAVLEAAGLSPRRGRPTRRHARGPRPGQAPDRDRGPARLLRGQRRPGRVRPGRRTRRDGRAGAADPARPGARRRDRRGVRLRPHRGVRHRELGVHDDERDPRRQARRHDDQRPGPGAGGSGRGRASPPRGPRPRRRPAHHRVARADGRPVALRERAAGHRRGLARGRGRGAPGRRQQRAGRGAARPRRRRGRAVGRRRRAARRGARAGRRARRPRRRPAPRPPRRDPRRRPGAGRRAARPRRGRHRLQRQRRRRRGRDRRGPRARASSCC